MKSRNKFFLFFAMFALVMVIAFSGCMEEGTEPQENVEPCPVRDLNASNNVAGVATLTWNLKCPVLENTNGTEIAFYKIYRNGEHVSNSQDNQYIDYGVKDDEEYTYQVSAVSSEGIEGPKSDPATIKVKPGMPGV